MAYLRQNLSNGKVTVCVLKCQNCEQYSLNIWNTEFDDTADSMPYIDNLPLRSLLTEKKVHQWMVKM